MIKEINDKTLWDCYNFIQDWKSGRFGVIPLSEALEKHGSEVFGPSFELSDEILEGMAEESWTERDYSNIVGESGKPIYKCGYIDGYINGKSKDE